MLSLLGLHVMAVLWLLLLHLTSEDDVGVTDRCNGVSNRLHFAGQTKPTRVVRLLTEGTIEKSILAYQRKKLQTPGRVQTGIHLQEAELLAGSTLADLLAAHP